MEGTRVKDRERVGVSGTYREDVVIRQFANQSRHSLEVVIDPAEQNGLVADHDARLQQLLAGQGCDPRDLVGVVEVRVQRDRLARLLCHVGNVDQGVHPAVRAVDDAAGRHRKALGGEAEAADVGDADEPLADQAEVLWHEIVRVAARHDDVV